MLPHEKVDKTIERHRGNEKLLTRAIYRLEDHRDGMDRADHAAVKTLMCSRGWCLLENVKKEYDWELLAVVGRG